MNNHCLADIVLSPSCRASSSHGATAELPSISSSGEICEPNSSLSSKLPQEAKQIIVPFEIENQFRLLTRQLTQLGLKVKNACADFSVNIEDLQHVIKRDCGLSPLVGDKATFEGVFHRLEDECSIFYPSHLSHIVNTFLPENQILKEEIQNFGGNVSKFKSSTELRQLIELIKKNEENSHHEFCQVMLKVREFWGNFTIELFETVVKELLGDLYTHLLRPTVDRGCYSISWAITNIDITTTFKLMPRHSIEFVKVNGVISLEIDEEMVYDLREMPGCEVLEAAMLQAIELKNTQAIDLLRLCVSCCNESITDSVKEPRSPELKHYQQDTPKKESGALVPDIENISAAPTSLGVVAIMKHFESMLPRLTEVISSPSYNLDCLKKRISDYLQSSMNSSEVEHFLHDLKKCTSASSIVNILTQSNLVSYLNFQLLDLIKSDEFDNDLERYASEYRVFMENSINSITEAFMRELPLALPLECGLHLPEITVELDVSWGTKPYLHWQKIMENNIQWSNHIMIKSFRPNPIVITYYVLPFVWPTVVNDLLDNQEMIKRFSAVDATFSITSKDLLQSDFEKMKLGTQSADDLALMKIGTTVPLTATSTDKEQSSTPTITGGYESNLFCSLPSGKLECPICKLTAREPWMFICCGKLICEGCYHCLTASTTGKSCPCCKAEPIKAKVNKKRKREIMQLMVKCPASNCYWTGTLDCLENKKHKCPQSKDEQEMKIRAERAESKIAFTKQKSDDSLKNLGSLHMQMLAPIKSHEKDSEGM